MAKSPFYKVLIEYTGEDITEVISSLSYEDCTKEDDFVTINVEAAEFDLVDRDVFDVGQKVIFQYGFIGGKSSKKKVAVITDSECTYSKKKAFLTVKAKDLGFYTKKLTSKLIYKDKTASEIAKDIASKFGLKSVIETTTIKYASLAMAGKTYMQFLKELADTEGSKSADTKGPINVCVRGDTLYFTRRDLSVKSTRTFVYGDGDGPVISFKTNWEDAPAGSASVVSASGVDEDTGKVIKSEAKQGDNKETTTGESSVNFDVNGVLKNTTLQSEAVGKSVVVPAGSQGELDSVTGGIQKSKNAKVLKCTLEIDLDPTVEADIIITMAGVAKKHSGNWQIEKVVSKVDGGGGRTTLTGVKNGTMKSTTTDSSKNSGQQNKTQGDTDGKTEKEIKRFDTNGNPK
jgi:hypothetical protein